MKDDANASFLRALARGAVNEHDLPPLGNEFAGNGSVGNGSAGNGVAEGTAKESGRPKEGQASKQNGRQKTDLPPETRRTMGVPSRLR
jgi:hypothetical protein